MRGNRRVVASWQYEKLTRFVAYELEEIHIQRIFEDLTGFVPSWGVGEVMHFIENRKFLACPGALITLFRASREGDGCAVEFNVRYNAFYAALKQKGFL